MSEQDVLASLCEQKVPGYELNQSLWTHTLELVPVIYSLSLSHPRIVAPSSLEMHLNLKCLSRCASHYTFAWDLHSCKISEQWKVTNLHVLVLFLFNTKFYYLIIIIWTFVLRKHWSMRLIFKSVVNYHWSRRDILTTYLNALLNRHYGCLASNTTRCLDQRPYLLVIAKHCAHTSGTVVYK